MISSLRGRLALLFLAFFLVVTISVVATTWMIDAQKQDARVINLAGRQRMLVQQMTKDALLIEQGREGDQHQSLQEAARTFDQTLRGLIDATERPYLPDHLVSFPGTQRSNILEALSQVAHTWATFSGYLDIITRAGRDSSEFKEAVNAMERLAPTLVQQADDVVRMYEMASTQRVTRLQWIQLAFFASALALLAVGFVFTENSVVNSLSLLGSIARRIGGGDLSTPVPFRGPREITLLAHSLDTMRAQLKASQDALLAWAEELEARVAQRTRELAALYEVSREISSRLEIGYVLRSVTDKARELLDSEVALLCLLDSDGQTLNLQAISGPQAAVCGSCTLARHSPASHVLTADRALVCSANGHAGRCGLIAVPFQASHLAAPLRVGERAIGALCVGSSKSGIFSGEASTLLTKLANSAAIALENARLYEQSERVATLEERQRIAAEMHDGLAQALSYLSLKVEQVVALVEAGRHAEAKAGLQHISVAIDQATSEVRQSIANLQASRELPQSLQDHLARIVGEFGTRGTPPVELVIRLQDPLLLSSDATEQILRVVREALLNAFHHAQARHITVHLEQRGGEAVVIVEDDGRGFDPKAPPMDGSSHFGLSIMRARAARIGGQVTIASAPGQGTRVSLSWPINPGPMPVQG